MDVLDIARWQFGIITVYHFLFVPLTIGLTAVIAGLETAWVRTGKEDYLRLTKFFGKLFLINFAIGVVTGIVQEFQFGMNWSDYSRFVGDVFGAPLAIEGLLAFFLESTFLGLWIFGWDKLPRGLHAACMWLVHLGTLASSYFILAANSWMQHPVGYRFNPESGRAELTDFWAVMFNKVQLVTFPHVIFAAYMTAGAFLLGVSAYLYMKKKHEADRPLYHRAIRIGAVVTLLAGLGVAITGDFQGKVMTEVQPMKMAAAEGLYETSEGCAPFSVLTIGTPDGAAREVRGHRAVPAVLPRHRLLRRHGAGHQPAQGGVRREVRHARQRRPRAARRRLRAGHPGHLLVVPLHDGPRLLRRRRCRADPLADPQGAHARRPLARRARAQPADRDDAGLARGAGSSPRWAASRGSSSA